MLQQLNSNDPWGDGHPDGGDGRHARLRRADEMWQRRRNRAAELLRMAESSEWTSAEKAELEAAAEELLHGAQVTVADVTQLESAAARRSVGSFYRWIGDRVYRLRKARGFTQGQLATRAGIGQPHLSLIETGKHIPTRPTTDALARALGLSGRQEFIATEETFGKLLQRMWNADDGAAANPAAPAAPAAPTAPAAPVAKRGKGATARTPATRRARLAQPKNVECEESARQDGTTVHPRLF